jgi:hypothetical protein
MRRSLGLVGVAAAVALVGTTAQAAAPERTWHGGVIVARQALLQGGALAANGDALASGTTARVEVATRNGFAGAWTVRPLSGALNGGTSTVSAINDAGAAVVLWRAPAHSVYSSVRATRTGAWRTLVVPSGATARGNDGFFTPSAAMNAKGQATVVWAAHEQHGWAVRSAFRSGTNAIWRATPALALTPPPGSVMVRTNAEGDAIAAWSAPGSGGAAYVALRAAHKAWGPATAIGTTAFEGTALGAPPSVSIAPNGRVAVAWAFDPNSDVTQSQVKVATGSALTGQISASTTIATGIAPSIAINSSGALAAVWAVSDSGFYNVTQYAAVAPDGTTWTTPPVLEAVGSNSELNFGNVVLSESGRAFASWSVHVGPGAYTATGASAGADGVWTRFLNTTAGSPTVITLALNGPGDALALTNYENQNVNPIPFGTKAYSYDGAQRVTHAQWVWVRSVFIPAHFAPAQRATVWTRLTANPSAALALVRRYAPASIR